MLLEDVSAWLIYTTRYTDVLQLVFSCLCSVTNSVLILSFTEGSIQERVFNCHRGLQMCFTAQMGNSSLLRHGKLTTNAKAAAVLKCVQSWKAPEHDAVLVQGGILKGRAEQLHSLIIAFFHWCGKPQFFVFLLSPKENRCRRAYEGTIFGFFRTRSLKNMQIGYWNW